MKRITTRNSAPERSEGKERSDESTPLLGTIQIDSTVFVAFKLFNRASVVPKFKVRCNTNLLFNHQYWMESLAGIA